MTGTALKKFFTGLSPFDRKTKKNRPNTQKGNQKKSKKTGKRQIFKDLLARLSNRAEEVTSSPSTQENSQNAEQGRPENLLNINSRAPVVPNIHNGQIAQQQQNQQQTQQNQRSSVDEEELSDIFQEPELSLLARIEPNSFDEFRRETQEIDNLLDDYRSLTNANDPDVEQRFQVLTDIETIIYEWYNRHFNQNPPAESRQLTYMFNVLDDIAQEYEKLVAQITDTNKRLPIPNINGNYAVAANSPEDNNLQQLWQQIVNESGNINFLSQYSTPQMQIKGTPPEDYPDFKQKILPSFARILRTPTGRRLLTDILGTQPGNLSPQDQQQGMGTVTVGPSGTQEVGRGSLGTTGPKSYENNRHCLTNQNTNGLGMGSSLRIHVYDRETEQTRARTGGVDTSDNPLLSPKFIIFAHELIHALHNLRGVNRRNATPSLADWGTEEEKVTISGRDQNNNLVDNINEQAIRNEYGLNQERYGHQSGSTTQ
jgi:hypothetical protein